jgi:Amt family ammonium transporter
MWLGMLVNAPDAAAQDTNDAAAAQAPAEGAETAPTGESPASPLRQIDRGDNAWMLTSTALVLMMTGPGLAMFYGGLVRKKNVLSVVMQCLTLMA